MAQCFRGGGATLKTKLKKLLTLWGKNHIAGNHVNGELNSHIRHTENKCQFGSGVSEIDSSHSFTSTSLRIQAHKFQQASTVRFVTMTTNNSQLSILHSQFKNAAFTLAEVLITLTILGVIAVIVVPNLHSYYKRTYTITRLKQSYSILSNLVSVSEAENGSWIPTINTYITNPNNWQDMSNFDAWTDKYVIPYLNVVEDSKNTPVAQRAAKFGGILKTNGQSTGMSMYNAAMARNVKLKNGIVLHIFDYTNSYYNKGICFIVDINGTKKPNRLGYDIFVFEYFKDQSNHGYAQYRHPGGLLPGTDSFATYLNNSTRVRNNCINTQTPTTCSKYIIDNGWKIPNDYPYL